jgi:hypothetical protein
MGVLRSGAGIAPNFNRAGVLPEQGGPQARCTATPGPIKADANGGQKERADDSRIADPCKQNILEQKNPPCASAQGDWLCGVIRLAFAGPGSGERRAVWLS